MAGCGLLCFRSSQDFDYKQEILYQEEKKKAEKNLKVIKSLHGRQSAHMFSKLHFDVFGCRDMLEIYSDQKNFRRISIQDRIEGLQRLNSDMEKLEKNMRKTKLSFFPWLMEMWRVRRADRAYKLSEARREKEYTRRINAVHGRK